MHDLQPESTQTPSGGIAASGAPAGGSGADRDAVRQRVIDVLRNVYDPEIPVNIYELGMIYDIDVDDVGNVKITMTLTSPSCPVAESLPREVEVQVSALEDVRAAQIDLVWDPPWSPERMTEAAKLQLGMM
jgi:FeS assembly SUF system protein